MNNHEFQILTNRPMQLGESLVWNPEEASLYWIDIAAHEVHRMHPASREHASWPVPAEPGCLALTEDGRLLVAMRTGISILDPASGALAHYLEAPYDPALGRFNDGRCDAAGRLWVGSLCDARDRPSGSLYCIERGVIRDMQKPVTVSNGVAFSRDNATLYHADTSAHRITAYEFDLASASLRNPRLFQQFSNIKDNAYGGRPDGAAVDSENAYWCAMYEGARLLRIATTGEVLQELPLPVRCPTMVCFGGRDLRTLYITSVRHNRSPSELDSYPLSGHILSVEVDVPGIADHRYRF